MDEALVAAASVQGLTAPNPWVGCVLVLPDGRRVVGRTHPPGGPHAEADALAQVGGSATGATMYVTLEPCAHHGRTPPCADAVAAAGVRRVVVALTDPDPAVAGRGLATLRRAGVEVVEGVRRAEAARLLGPYLRQRRTGRPYVVLKMAASLDGRTAAPDASSRWITGPEARADVHRLRARSDAILVGAGTVRADDPELTVRDVPSPLPGTAYAPQRVVLGSAPPGARVRPALELSGPLDEVLDELGRRGVLQLLVEGGAQVAGAFHRAGLVDRYVLYLAPVLFGGDDARPVMAGPGAPTIGDVWRGRVDSVARLGDDIRIDLVPRAAADDPTHPPAVHDIQEALS
ncbi:bifunctional diaminohydroxyphosphoribosylaminopyrimidine deaminase/5-amino-6-(5-phosphoribosylamino)uracil reductase RibD [Actinomarinicola tropica]|uniref:Riboflavin biosynthesis protein RibD n=2 Tax=Actinomarinicola tropica TaxID=2789776 RepID=A0A5Q2RJK2_9ACTN|nr:bifunctional diaminohydroxyphosphoribosylaminopyrimidine deaminase/5-amino-6-(5-phosphoribosylamino)uracil reductase RibD [Actinomarinicola tropica]